MESPPNLAESIYTREPDTTARKSRPYRHGVYRLAYVNLDHANGGIVRNLSETGIALQAVAPLHVNQQVHVRFELMAPRLRVEALGRVGWADSLGRAGVQFLNLPQRTQRLLKEWIFTQLIADTYRASEDSIFIQAETEVDLLFSPAHRPTIRLNAAVGEAPDLQNSQSLGDEDTVLFDWCPVAFSADSLSWLIDSLILLSAVLLFLMISLAMTHTLPAWTVLSGLGLGVACLFTMVYWLLLTLWMNATPGTCLVHHTLVTEHGTRQDEADRPRFR